MTPAERQLKRRAKILKRIDYMPSPQALKAIELTQKTVIKKAGGYADERSVYSAVIDSLILK